MPYSLMLYGIFCSRTIIKLPGRETTRQNPMSYSYSLLCVANTIDSNFPFMEIIFEPSGSMRSFAFYSL